jgi:hypothetical protein
MADKSGYAHGEPSWADLASEDVAGSKTFYATLFGWDADDVPMEDAGGYGMFSLGGRHVGGYGPPPPGRPVSWAVYVTVDDVDAVAEAATAAGGTVVNGPFDVFTSGRMAVVQDPTGATLSLWQPGDHPGAGVQDEANALTWVELSTTDVEAARAFYTSLLGWTTSDSSDVAGMDYTEFKLGERSVAGMMRSESGASYWMPYFQPADIDRTVGEATALGASVMVPKMAIPGGEFAILSDPQGAAFGLFRPDAARPTD